MSVDHEEKVYTEPSKSARKRTAKAVEELALKLAELPKTTFSRLEMPEDIRQELDLARNTRGHGSRKRQVKHLAGLLRQREELTKELSAFLAGTSRQQYEEKKHFHQLESLRDGLCDPALYEKTLQEVRELFPDIDIQALTHLAHSVHGDNDRQAYRNIFRLLKTSTDVK